MICNSPGINWTWFAHVTLHDDGTATIDCEYRLHKFDDYQGADRHPKATADYQILERSDKPLPGENFGRRMAFAVRIDNVDYPLRGGEVPRFSFCAVRPTE